MGSDHTRANRVRDNQRRFRERRKEYVTELEASLRELRRQGVQASREVQLAAQNVSRENKLLRELLYSYGAGEDVVDDWIRRHVAAPPAAGDVSQRARARCVKDKVEAKVEVPYAARAADALPCVDLLSDWFPSIQLESSAAEQMAHPPYENISEIRCGSSSTSNSSSSSSCQSTPVEIKPPSISSSPVKKCKGSGGCAKNNAPEMTLPQGQQEPRTCQLVTRYMENPSVDLRQVQIPDNSRNEIAQTADGVECSQAYEMLVQYATTDDKLEYMAVALERGCVKGPGGRCRVKNETMFRTLDELTS